MTYALRGGQHVLKVISMGQNLLDDVRQFRQGRVVVLLLIVAAQENHLRDDGQTVLACRVTLRNGCIDHLLANLGR